MFDPRTVVIYVAINDMPKVVGASKFSLFADDSKCHWKVIMTVNYFRMV